MRAPSPARPRPAVAARPPFALVVMGRIGSGKSTLARALAARLGAEVLSSDVLRKAMAGVPLRERVGPAARRRLYAASMTRRVYDALLDTAEVRLRAGRLVVLDATFARRARRQALTRRFARQGLAWFLVEAHAGDATVRRRLRARDHRADEVSDARLEDFAALARLYQPPDEVPRACRVRVSTTGPLAKAVGRALQGVARWQAEVACPSR